MAHSKEDRIYEALIPNDEDSPIFWKREAINWRRHPKIVKASRGIEDIQKELHVDENINKNIRRVFRNLTASMSDLKEDRSNFIPTLIGFLLTSVAGSLLLGFLIYLAPADDYDYWLRAVGLFLFIGVPASLLGACWRAYIDLYPRAAWHYWRKVRKEEREPISSIEAVEYLINLLSKDSITELSKAFSHIYYYNEFREEAFKYRDWLEKNMQKESIHSQEVLEMLRARLQAVKSISQKLNLKERGILERAKGLSSEIFPKQHKELVRISRSIAEMKSEESGNTKEIVAVLLKRKSEVEEAIISAVKFLREDFETALELVSWFRDEKYKNRDDEPVNHMSSGSLKRIQKIELTEEIEGKTETTE